MEEEEGDGVKEGAGGEGEHVGEEELLHFLVLLPWEGLEQELFGLATDKQQREENLKQRKRSARKNTKRLLDLK